MEALNPQTLNRVCPKPFILHDMHYLCLTASCRCTWAPDQAKPSPIVQPVSEEGAAPLVFDPKDWEMRWTQTQSSGDVYVIKISIGGTAGPFKLIVRWV